MTRVQNLFVASLFSSSSLAANLCTASQPCWPSSKTWVAFNSSIGGRLVAPRPPAWPCHDPNYDEVACNEVKANWGNSFWRSNQTGAMENPLWDNPNCSIDTPRNVTCDQGFVPVYSVAAIDSNDVSAAVKFAGKHRLRLVVKNTGHDYLGRSSGEGSFSIWTHNLRGIKFEDSFVPTGCPKKSTGTPAVTVGAAEQWRAVYQAANENNVIVVGGAANSVGAAGGWIQGGGHSPLGAIHGMGVDNVLQFNVVKPDGKIVAASACQNKDLFWALRGGGGGTWGVTLDVTYKTHPPINSVVAVLAQVNTTGIDQLKEATAVMLKNIPNMTKQGVRGYGFWFPPINSLALVLIHPNSTSVEVTNSTLGPVFEWAAQNPGVSAGSRGTVHPTFFNFFSQYITDIGIGTPSWVTGRLISGESLLKNSTEMSEFITGDIPLYNTINIVGGGAVNDFDPDSTGLNPQWRKDALVSWNFAASWPEGSSPEVIAAIKDYANNRTQALGELAGLDHAAYWNEANPAEPLWKKSFFGSHYSRLLKIKKQDAFNSSIGGRLVAPRPPAWPCHDPDYDETTCNEVKNNWANSFWRSNQTGAMENPLWDSPGCSIDSPRNVTCDQGLVPVYSVAAISASDVSAGVKFAGKHRLKLVVKNTGHDYLGRSSGEGSFGIWTHNIRGINFTGSFIPTGCLNATGIPAVTVAAAEQWRAVYQAADEHNVVVVGGEANTVGAAGGWVQGGGHSPLGGMYGMGVDNALQFNVVKPDGSIAVANACQNKDLFWALRGGGGGTWGVTLDVTCKTHPPLESIVAVLAQVNTTGIEQLKEASAVILKNVPDMTKQGVRGYGSWMLPTNSFSLVLIHPNSPSVEFTNGTLGPVYEWAAESPGVSIGASGTTHPTFFNFVLQYITDTAIAVPFWLSGRLISSEALLKNSTEMSKLISGDISLSPAINFVGGGKVNDFDPDSTGLNPQWRMDALVSWNYGGTWPDGSSPEVVATIKDYVNNYTQALGELSGLDHAAYFNEGNPGEPVWKKSFFGSHYDRLLEIKRQVDPDGLFTCNRCVGGSP